MRKNNILKNSLILAILTFGSRILGLVREVVKASFLGTSGLADSFNIGFLIPNLLRRLFAEGSIAVAFVPTLKGYLKDDEKQVTQEFIASTFTLFSFVAALTVSLGIIFSPLIVQIFENTTDETILLTQIMFPYLLFISVAAVFQGVLNSLNIFAPSGFVPILFNVIVIGCTFLLSPYTGNPARAMAVGVIAGGFIQAAFQLPFIIKSGYKITFTGLKRAFTNPGTKKVLRLIAPTVIGVASYQVNNLVSSQIATTVGQGTLSALYYSLRLQELVLGIFAVSLGTVILSELSDNARKEKWDAFRRNLGFSVDLTTLIMVPVSIFAFLHSTEIVTLLFKLKSFDETSVLLTAGAFSFHTLGILFVAIQRIVSPAFYAQKDSKTPAIIGVVSIVVNIILAFILSGPVGMGGNGIALAVSIAAVVNVFGLFIMLGRKNPTVLKGVVSETLLYSLKIIIIAGAAMVPIYLLRINVLDPFFISDNKIIRFGLPLLIAGIVYFALIIGLLVVMKDKKIMELKRRILKK